MKAFFEQMFFHPKWYHYVLMILLFPFSMLYAIGMFIRRVLTAKTHFSIPIISVGNLIVGGSGKTPFVIDIASRYEGVTIISRGYGRESQGRVEVSKDGQILTSVKSSGDEAMLMALSLPSASVIVCEDRLMAIEVAMRERAKIIILDDGFNRVEIEKFEILLEPRSIPNILTFPAGAWREFYFTRKYADIIAIEEKDFIRKVETIQATDKMLLVTAISNPQRLEPYLPKGIVGKVYYDDHAYFGKKVLEDLMNEHQASSILCTSKDKVKMEDFKLPISEMKLKLEIKKEIYTQIDAYIEGFNNAK